MKLTKYEKDILVAFENKKLNTIRHLDSEKKRYAAIAKESIKNKSISIRVNSDYLDMFKAKSERLGIPYQTMISSFIKRFALGEIKFP